MKACHVPRSRKINFDTVYALTPSHSANEISTDNSLKKDSNANNLVIGAREPQVLKDMAFSFSRLGL